MISIFIVMAKFVLLVSWCLCYSGDEKESANQPDTSERNAYGDMYENRRTTANLNRIQSSETEQQSLRVNFLPEIILTPTQNIIRYTTAEKNGNIANPPSYFELECDQLPSYASLYPPK